MIKIDGSYLEGGGAVLRMSSILAAATNQPAHIFNIRKFRPNGGGLREQHLKSLGAVAELCGGRIENAEIGSKEINFYPGQIRAKDINVKIETAGSITLVLQTLTPIALFITAPVKIIFDGGATDTFFSPTIDYFRSVFLKILEKKEIRAEINILKRGYYPEGGAKVEVKIHPVNSNLSARPEGLNLIKRGGLKRILALSGASRLLQEKKVAERQLMGVREILGKLNLPIEEKVEYYQTRCPGSQICLAGEFENTVIGVDGLGKLGKRAEDIGREAALELLKEQKSEACLDKHLADQILPYLALAKKKSSATVSEITDHCKTNIWVIENFLEGKFEIKSRTKSGPEVITWLPKKG